MRFWVLFAILFCYGLFAFTIIVHIVPHATDLGFSTATAANILATFGGLTVIGMVALGIAADRIGSQQAYIIGFIITSVALLLLIPSREG